ncbi:DUF2510 domain-containing protein, partial [Streptomyces albidoflavus]
MNTPLPPPGWYVDPAAPPPAVERWWDGTGWTAHTRAPAPRTAPGPAALVMLNPARIARDEVPEAFRGW